eukprot:TRINITY_DN32315_c0_g1_i1.p1 TRINITY_DN32315_c0_g1~~TRINITY_DN32315_c0_g1_i1.p1  ORF type:complete len:443 (-),score=94.17 TRINITY_DN32315_c0_g1_i1:25-1353(-)
MLSRCLSLIAAVAQPTAAIQANLMSGEESNAGLVMSVQMRQYAFLNSNEEATGGHHAEWLQRHKPSHLVAGVSARRLGASVSLTEEGFVAVASLRSTEAMAAFAENLAAEDGLNIEDMNMLRRVVPFYNGECAKQSLKALRNELHQATVPHGCHAAWVTADASKRKHKLKVRRNHVVDLKNVTPQQGDVAPLNEAGYLSVAALVNNDEMKKFIRRVSKSEGLQVMSEGGLAGFAKYYSGVCAMQSFRRLVTELKTVAPMVKTTAVSYEVHPSESLDGLKRRVADVTGLDLNEIDVDSEDESAPDAANLKRTFAEKLNVDEKRVHVSDAVDAARETPLVTPPKPAKKLKGHKKRVHVSDADDVQPSADEDEQSADVDAPTKTTKTVVVTVTSPNGAVVADSLKELAEDPVKPVTISRAPVTMAASIPKSAKCGGGWVAPSAAK